MIDLVGLINDLSTHGVVDLIGENNTISYILVMSDVTDITVVENILESYIITEYPNRVTSTLVGGIYKAQYNK
jgi:hypothetical protein